METDTVQPVVTGILEMSPGRLAAVAAYTAGAVGVILGGLARRAAGKARQDRGVPDGGGRGRGRHRGNAAMLLGLFSLVTGGTVLATADGGVGAGSGVAGGLLAILLGLVALTLGRLARARARGVA